MPRFRVQLFELKDEQELQASSIADIDPEALWPELSQIEDWGLEYMLRFEESEGETIQEENEDRFFSPQEGQAKIGQLVKSKEGLFGVPQGTLGRVVSFHQGTLAVRWAILPSLQDWFSKWEYDRYLEEVKGE